MFEHRKAREFGRPAIVQWYDAWSLDAADVARARENPESWLPLQCTMGWAKSYEGHPSVVIVMTNVCDDANLPEEDEAVIIPKAWVEKIIHLTVPRSRRTPAS